MYHRRGLDLDVSLLERLATCGRFPVNSLVEQRRMRPEISRCGLIGVLSCPLHRGTLQVPLRLSIHTDT